MTEAEIQELAVIQQTCKLSLLFSAAYFETTVNKMQFTARKHTLLIADALERVMRGECRRLAISVSPRLGKTILAVHEFMAHCFALNPACKFIHLSATDDLAMDNSVKTKNIVKSADYQLLFPEVQIKKGTDNQKKWYTTEGGGLYALSAAGQVTGFGAGGRDIEYADPDKEDPELNKFLDSIITEKGKFQGAIIIDDPMKPEDANSDIKRNVINRRYISTIKNRGNSRNTPIIIIAQRVHKQDLIGFVQEVEGLVKDGGEWETLVIPELWTDENGVRQCLDPSIRTVADLEAMEISHNDETRYIFQTQHMQDPTTREGLMFPLSELKFYDPTEIDVLGKSEYNFNAVDPADKGGDDLSGPYASLIGDKIFIHDVIFNKNGTDYNEPLIVENFIKYMIHRMDFEANNAWGIMLSNIKRDAKERGLDTICWGVKNTTNKHTRILAMYAFIKSYFYFRSDWQKIPHYRRFMEQLTTYMMVQEGGGNAHDDAPDSCAMVASFFQKQFRHLFGPKQ